jgi:predicted  nucleic acid-binding Zn-ribbon protein
VEAFKQRALFAERAVGDLKTEQGTAKARIEQLGGKVTSLEGQVGQARERTELCDRELSAQGEQLSASADRLRLCNRMLREAESTSTPQPTGLLEALPSE